LVIRSFVIRHSSFVIGLFLLVSFIASAADKSGVTPNTISLPKGPGSIEGLGDSFQPTLNTGTAKYALDLKLPPGTAGHQPSLTLSYEGGSGNGPLGYGWAINLPHIQRRIDQGIPTYGEPVGVDRPDTFVNESRELLVPTADGYFFCENEGAFVRYQRLGDHWEATSPDGTRLRFGITPSGRVEDVATGRVFRWLLEQAVDTQGNTIEYVYRLFPGGQNLNQKYLALVRYGPGAPALSPSNAPPWPAFHFVSFEYESRPDWFEDARAGFLIRTGQRLRSIRVATQGLFLTNHLAGDFNNDGVTDYLNRRYDLGYLKYDGAASHWSLLSEVRLIGADGITGLPPATFDYAVSNPPGTIDASSNVWASINAPTALMDNPLVDLIDLNADGLPDVLKTETGGNGHSVAINRGPTRTNGMWAIQWASPASVDAANGAAWNFDLGSAATHLADMDGDGLADLVHKTADESVFYFANRGRLAWSERRDMAYPDAAPPAPFGNAGVRTADLDFDKRIDIVQSIDIGGAVAYRVWFNRGNQTYSAPFTAESEGGFDLNGPGVQIADCNGDRVPDIARIQSGAIMVGAGLGYGRFAAPLALVVPDVTLEDQQIASAKLTDINGDGLADLVLERAAPGQCWFWLNLGNYTLAPRRIITGLPATTPGSVVRWADLNGNGSTDLIYADSAATPPLQMIEVGELLSGGLAPNLLTNIDNGIGRVTTIEYAPSTQFAQADEAAGRQWPDPVPFPVTVVASVTVSDSLGHQYLTRYRYHDGYYDPAEKQFRGFAHVEQIDVGDASAPTFVSRSRFDTGRNFDAMKGRLLASSAETEDGAIFSRQTNIWSNPPRTLQTGTNGVLIRFAHPTGTVMEILERGMDTPRRLETESEYDNYGNITRSINYGIVEPGNRSAFDDERITIAEYALNLNRWLIRLPKRNLVQDENGVVISKSELFYDDETFAGNNLGQVALGNLTMRRGWIDPSSETNYVNMTRTKYDSFGNPVAFLDPLAIGTGNPLQGHLREVAYDDIFHSYAVRETIHVGNGTPPLIFNVSYDRGLGTLDSATDLNLNITHYGYDSLGRLIRIVRPGDTEFHPTTEYDYALGLATAEGGIVNYLETRQRDQVQILTPKPQMYRHTRQFTDGLGRALMTRTEAEPVANSAAPRVAVTGAALFTARQKPARVLNPFFTTRSGTLEDLLAFENIEASGWTGQFSEDGSLVTLNLANAHQASTEYDATLRALKVTNPDGTFRRSEFAPLLTRTFDENDTDPASIHAGTPKQTSSDGLGRIIQLEEMVRLNDDGTSSASLQTWTSRFQYDLNDRLIRMTDPQGNVKQLRFDGLQRKIWMNDPDGGISSNRYDAASNLIETTDAKGQLVTYTYDGANRTLTEDYHDDNSPDFRYGRTPDVTFHYDSPAGPVDQGNGAQAAARNVRGLLAWVEDNSGEEHTSYDERGRVEWTVKRVPDPVLSPNLTPQSATLVAFRTVLDYDPMDRVIRMTYPDNDEIRYQYNARGLLQSIPGGPTGNILTDLKYLPSAQQEQINYGNGVRTTYAYDRRQRLRELTTMNPQITAPLIDFHYELDASSNVRTILDQRPASLILPGDPRRNTQHFQYDDSYRLTQVSYSPGSSPSSAGPFINYRYDRIGNMLAQTSDIESFDANAPVTNLGDLDYGGPLGRYGRMGRQPSDPAGPHALTSIRRPPFATRDYPYDANGNLLGIDGLHCTWDFRDRLVAIEDDSMRADYRYDYSGRRVMKKVLWKSGEPLAPGPSANLSPSSTATIYVGRHFEVRDHDQPVKYVFNGATRVAKVTGSLSSNLRLQRLRLHTGWTLVSPAVTLQNVHPRLVPGVIEAAYLFVTTNGSYAPIEPGQTIPAGAVLWVKANTNTVVSLLGEYQEPMGRSVATGAGFVAASGLETTRVQLPSTVNAGYYDATERRWRNSFAALPFLTDLPGSLAPGEAFFVQTDTPFEFAIPEPASRILFYHQDHLGSSSVITDATGALVQEIANYPSGFPRVDRRLRAVESHYTFGQKERDVESGLYYFEARYMPSALARFATPDPKYLHPDGLSSSDLSAWLANSQMFNLYAYAVNNPVKYADPSGLELWIPIYDDWDELDVGQTLINMTPIVGQVAGKISNFVGGTDYDVRSPLAHWVTEATGSYDAGSYTEDVVGFVAGGGGIRATARSLVSIVKNPGAFVKGSWSALKQDLKLAFPGRPPANASFGSVRVGPPRTASGVVEGGGGVAARTANAAELAPTIPNGTMVTGMPPAAQRASAQQMMREMYADPHIGPLLRAADANRAAIDKVMQEKGQAAAVDMLRDVVRKVTGK
jgi:RHS repeat-associated protein